MQFTKMHGLGNDFIMVDGFKEKLPPALAKAAINLCDRHFGIGADGLILVLPSQKADVRMVIINSDGSEAEMCGNGIRCFARYVYESGHVQKEAFTVETLAGIMGPKLTVKDGVVTSVTVDMGEPSFERSAVPIQGQGGTALAEPLEVLDKTMPITTLLMGVPHTVVFVDNVAEFDLHKYGPALENHPIFPRKTNANFAQILNKQEIKHRVWERGAGPTLACGTGACATLVASVLNKLTERTAKVHLPGGTLEVEWAQDNHVYLTGPAAEVFRGELADLTLLT